MQTSHPPAPDQGSHRRERRPASWLRAAAAIAAAWLGLGAGAGEAATPRDMFVMATQIDDVITLDPAALFEFSAAEIAANVYDRLLGFDLEDSQRIEGAVAETWSVSEDGRTFRFAIRPGLRFHSGNPVTAADAAYSLRRVVRLDKSPAFILNQFGFTPANVDARIRAADERTLVIETERAFAPSFLLACLTSAAASIVDSRLVEAHAENGDMGSKWLATHSAGSGPFRLALWKPNELVILERFADHWRGASGMRKVFIRHIPEPGTQRLLLERGDIDVARNLGPDQAAAIAGRADLRLRFARKGALYYLGLNQANPLLSRPQVRRALKLLVDYEGIARTILRGKAEVRQSVIPAGFLGAVGDSPYRFDPATAKTLLAEAGLAEGFRVRLDVRNTRPDLDVAQSIQASFAAVGVAVDIVPGDGKQVLTKYRARRHDLYYGRWGPDYQDPHSNAQAFASNPDNSQDAAMKTLAWRNNWQAPELARLSQAAVFERDPKRRAALYADLQRRALADSPFVVLFQEVEMAVERANVRGFVLGPGFDTVFYRGVTKE